MQKRIGIAGLSDDEEGSIGACIRNVQKRIGIAGLSDPGYTLVSV